jgi:hypothetical protein
MFQGHYIRWNPVPEFEGKRLYCEALHDDREGFRLWLQPEPPGRMLVVKFDHLLFYASSDEARRLAAVQNSAEMKFPHAFWKVENSALIAEFHRQSAGTVELLEIMHFAFLTANQCVDVLAIDEPVFSK